MISSNLAVFLIFFSSNRIVNFYLNVLHMLVFYNICEVNFSNQEICIYMVDLFNSPMADSNFSSGIYLCYSTLLSYSASSFFELL